MMSLSLIFSVSCGNNLQTPSSALPTWKMGDTWITRVTWNGTYIFTATITGEEVINGTDCYIQKESISPTFEGLSEVTVNYDKSTGEKVERRYVATIINGTNLNVITSYHYPIIPNSLQIGTTWEETENTTSTWSFMGQIQTTSNIDNYTYHVVSVENVTVPAGTFTCFRITKSRIINNVSSLYSTIWEANASIGHSIKTIINSSGMVGELLSYPTRK